jgi:hypothetical protein
LAFAPKNVSNLNRLTMMMMMIFSQTGKGTPL